MADPLAKAAQKAGARPPIPRRVVIPVPFGRPGSGPVFEAEVDGLASTMEPGFISNGGPTGSHPFRRRPFGFEAKVPYVPGKLKRLSLTGVFALHAGPELEEEGSVGASLCGLKGKEMPFRFNFVRGKTYGDAANPKPVTRIIGDGTSIQTVGTVEIAGQQTRVELLTIDLPPNCEIDRIVFNDLGTPASFIIFDVFLEAQAEPGFQDESEVGAVPLLELGKIIRLGDRIRFLKAVRQLEDDIDGAADLDNARAAVINFISISSAAAMELNSGSGAGTLGLLAARSLEKCDSLPAVKEFAQETIKSSVMPLLPDGSPHDRLIDRALSIVARNYAKPLTDEMAAEELGISASHFRFVFKQAIGQSFHQYLIAVRLERAYSMLLEGDVRVSVVAAAVGFPTLSHFSRAFSARFKMSPAKVRRQVRKSND